ncbi:flavin-containing monooxygenase [Mycobacteroides abscessus]|uniref:flavin-containing monooxygenase n=1 Tax=Mycobacteroides abscessus TaxID=36809 RepID=UPI0009CD04DA|nr:NAD(P)/FAD-dependent oxidoreductase [Mycobacteroides abscessus]SLG56466.1 Probable monooxygenase [Mycobacteroides abscessus subsp. abscessus]
MAKESRRPEFTVMIIGAGFGGIASGIDLHRCGIEDIVLVDKAPRVGGTWQANTYPGVAVDIPTLLYSFSYAKPRRWSKFFSEGEEVQDYAEQLVDTFGLRSKLRLNTEVRQAHWDPEDCLWTVETDGGEITARFLISAVGALEVPKLPDIDGLAEFDGKVVHTARWDHEYDYASKRIGVIGTGASALQLIPELASVAEHITVFQRTPIWVMPKLNFSMDKGFRQAIDHIPGFHKGVRKLYHLVMDYGILGAVLHYRTFPYPTRAIERLLRWHYRKQVPDPTLREKLTPSYSFFCKRPSMSNVYLKTLTEDHVDVVTEPISAVTGNRVVAADGTEREFDVIVTATGFKILEHGATPPFPVLGRNGLDIGDYWRANRFQAYQGLTVPGFPNLFLVSGPYGWAGSSVLESLEDMTKHVIRVISEAERRHCTVAEIRQQPHDEYFLECVRKARNTVILSGNCAGSNTYYINSDGDVPLVRPEFSGKARREHRNFPINHYHFDNAPTAATAHDTTQTTRNPVQSP